MFAQFKDLALPRKLSENLTKLSLPHSLSKTQTLSEDLPHTSSLVKAAREAVTEIGQKTNVNVSICKRMNSLIDELTNVCLIHEDNFVKAADEIMSIPTTMDSLKRILDLTTSVREQLQTLENGLESWSRREREMELEIYKKEQESKLNQYITSEFEKLDEKKVFYEDQLRQFELSHRQAKMKLLDANFNKQIEEYKENFTGNHSASTAMKALIELQANTLDVDIPHDPNELDAFLGTTSDSHLSSIKPVVDQEDPTVLIAQDEDIDMDNLYKT